MVFIEPRKHTMSTLISSYRYFFIGCLRSSLNIALVMREPMKKILMGL